MDHYQVKFKDDKGIVHYGTVNEFHPDAKTAPKGMVVVEDAVLPHYQLVPETILVDIASKIGHFDRSKNEWVDCDELHQYVQEQEKAAAAIAAKVKGAGIGAMFSVGVADGSATYVVVQVRGSKVKLEWRGFCPDKWQDRRFGLGGWFPKAEVESYIRQERGLREIFSKGNK